ncbi:DivIVA domain-containing protein [bacterium D16-51]|nr:DivIVA domain-containing protein [bacterium D16-59]RKI60169.1 DivIVA domain-containing protein [bacterium D16-51]
MLTPIDIQNHSLKTAVRGYSKKETDDFLEEILQGYESLYKENRELKDKVSSLSEGIQYYKQMETTLQKALVLAEKTSTETQEAAKSKADAQINEASAKAEAMLTESQTKAESILTEAQTRAESLLTEAQTKADSLLKEAQSEADAIRKETNAYSDIKKSKANRELEETRNHVRKLVQSYETYRLQFKKLAESQIEMLESENYSIFVPELAEMLDDAPDADTAMETEKTVAINLKSSEQIAAEAAIAENTPVADTASPAAFAAAEAAAGQEMDTPVNSVQQQVSVLASDIVPGSTPEALNAPIPEQQAVIRAGDIVPGSAAIPESVNTPIPAAESIHANDIVPGIVMPASAQTPDPAVIHANDIVPGSTVMPASAQTPDTTAIHANDIVPGSTVMPASTQTPDTAVIHADDIVPGNPAAVRQDGVMGQMQINNITPKIEGYQGAETKTVTPSQTSPFTFIDIE